MEKYRDVDEDELLQKLSEEELQRLEDELEELDPDVSIMTWPFSIYASSQSCPCVLLQFTLLPFCALNLFFFFFCTHTLT